MYNLGSEYFKKFQENKYDDLLDLVDLYDAFEDRPWNHTDFYKVLDKTYKDSRFILTTRDVEEWWGSYSRWGERVDLKNSWHYKMNSNVCYGVDSFLDNPNLAKQAYLNRNREVRNYFKGSSNFLEINIEENNKFEKLCNFLGTQNEGHQFPHLNRTI